MPIVAAPPGCSLSAPDIGDQVVCLAGSQDVITVPAGANAVSVEIRGAGGGAGLGDSSFLGSDGGSGAKVVAQFNISGENTLAVIAAGPGVAGTSSAGAIGGGISAMWRVSSSPVPSDVLVVAGSGGGGQPANCGYFGLGGSGGALGTSAGANGGSSTNSANAGVGADGSGTGGAGATGGIAGSSWASGGAAGTGAGASPYGGSGGAGYGGGGGGNGFGGGGAGGSFASSSYLIGSAVYSASGGAGGIATTGVGGDGVGGQITFTFLVSATPVQTQASETSVVEELTWEWEGGSFATAAVLNTWVQTPTALQVTRPGYRLLGWSTSADFPVEIAETSGGVFDAKVKSKRMIFIPEGKYTFLSSPNTLYPIWGVGEKMSRC